MRQALTRLYALGPGRMLPGRDRLRRLLSIAGDPHLAVPAVLVGGTNGKGWLVAALSAVLSTRYTTGAFLKPHLKSIRERWRIDDRPVEERLFVEKAHETCGLIEAHGEPISFFEANVLLGALLFRDSGCDIAIWEVGLGGKEDACNLVEPLLSALTNVGYDHQAVLGGTLAKIAEDKAHICRRGRPLLLGPPRPGWEDAHAGYAPVVQRVCSEKGASFRQVEAVADAQWRDYISSGASGLPPDTLALAHAALDALELHGLKLPPAAKEKGLGKTYYRGRMERAELDGMPVLLDAAHNVDSLRWLARCIGGHGVPPHQRRHPVIFGCQATRDPVALLAEIRPIVAQLVPIEIPVLRPCPLAKLISAAEELDMPVSLPSGFEAVARGGLREPNSAASLRYALDHRTELDEPDDSTGWIGCVKHGLALGSSERPAVICGSIYCLGEILRVFEGWGSCKPQA